MYSRNEIKNEIPKDTKVIEIYEGYEITQTDNLSNTLETMPIGTPLKIKGIVEGMDGQQLVYCGSSYDHEIKWLKTYWFYDGIYGGRYPKRFGFFENQMFYKGVTVIFNENEKEKVDELRSSFNYHWSIAESYETNK